MNAKNFVTKHEHVINSYIMSKKVTKHEHVNYSIMNTDSTVTEHEHVKTSS